MRTGGGQNRIEFRVSEFVQGQARRAEIAMKAKMTGGDSVQNDQKNIGRNPEQATGRESSSDFLDRSLNQIEPPSMRTMAMPTGKVTCMNRRKSCGRSSTGRRRVANPHATNIEATAWIRAEKQSAGLVRMQRKANGQ